MASSQSVDPWEKSPTGAHPLVKFLRALPSSQGYRRDDDATFVSWEDAGKWTTRSYDRMRLPRDVRELFTAMKVPETWLFADAKG